MSLNALSASVRAASYELSTRQPDRVPDRQPTCTRYVSTVSGPRADTELYPLYLDRDTVIQYVLYLIVSGLEADTD